jgi:Zn-finger nucleic acid-binding protein
MLCPNCKKELGEVKEFSHYGSVITLNQCKNCGGIWFNNLELFALEEEEAKKLEDIRVKNPTKIYSDNQKERLCPLCKLPLAKLKDQNIPKKINIESCQKCGGFWMNHGETIKYKEYQKDKIKEESLESIEQKKNDELKEIIAQKDPELLLKLEENEINPKSTALLGDGEKETDDMNIGKLIVKILAAGLSFYFLISEAHYIITDARLHLYEMFFCDPDLFIITILKAILIFIALPALYLFKLLAYFDVSIPWSSPWGDGWVSSKQEFFQTKLFYWAIYIIIFILTILRLVGLIFDL